MADHPNNAVGSALPAGHRLIEGNAGWLLILALLFGILAIAWKLHAWVSVPLLGIGGIAVILLLTRPLKTPSEIAVVFQIGYGFLVAAAAGSMYLVFSTRPLMLDGEQDCFGTDNNRVCPTIAIVPGCDYGPPRSARKDGLTESGEVTGKANGMLLNTKRAEMPEDAHCGDIPPQWVISIGGNVLRCHINGNCPRPDDASQAKDPAVQREQPQRPAAGSEGDSPQEQKQEQAQAGSAVDPEQLKADSRRTTVALARSRAAATAARNEERRLNRLINAQADIDPRQIAEARERGSRETEEAAGLQQELVDLTAQIESLGRQQAISANVQGSPIVGGLVVPLYFVVLAVLGALVSMARKLPEYHHRTDQRYEEIYNEMVASGEGPRAPISPTQARDYVVFQMLQVLSAPVIAVVAFSWARPDDIAGTAVLAFAAGFSAEIFLMAVRGITDRLIGAGLRGPRVRLRGVAKDPAKDAAKVIPLGPVSPLETISLTPFRKGDEVVLLKPLGTFRPGARAIVIDVDAEGMIRVRTTRDSKGAARAEVLEAKGPGFFRHAGLTDQDPAGPAG